MNLRITSDLAATLHKLAANALPEEACGLLLGRDGGSRDGGSGDGQILALRPARNVADDPARRFEIDPAMLLATHREARGLGLKVIGHYHSHPNGRAAPSRRDAARAVEDGQIWLIVTAQAITAWAATATGGDGTLHGRFLPVNLKVQ